MNPSHVGGVRAFNELYEDFEQFDATKGDISSLSEGDSSSNNDMKRKNCDTSSWPDNEKVAKLPDQESKSQEEIEKSRKIYVGSLPSNVTEKPLAQYFSVFGKVTDCKVIRDRTTGISRGFAFVTFICESMASAAAKAKPHIFEGRQIRVSNVSKDPNHKPSYKQGGAGGGPQKFLDDLILPIQHRIFIGPLDDSISGSDLMEQFAQFGTIKGVSRIKAADTLSKKSYGFIDYLDPISTKRAFASKTFVKGKHVKIAMSKFAMETALSNTTVYFYEAHQFCDNEELEKHFRRFGQIFRCSHFREVGGINKSFGFVDFVSVDSADSAIKEKSQLLHPGQYVKVSKILPQSYLYDMFSMSEKDGIELVRKLENVIPTQGTWGANPRHAKTGPMSSDETVSKVRIPAKLIGKLIGERGKVITEISRDSKTQITIPKVEDEVNVIVSVYGTKDAIKAAQYLMQKVLKS